ncbi:precorrin-6A/cobalt-precorrin-6A reductase [Marinomonas balearica]|uniref:Precorrin-6A/cobalt-precorrin-6A reductase n=1 Tax=Marinomonas balearica TaxID=491947 RepID=A0A4R6MCM0_9GAMM|nr:precorrin-6A/cobalt-precorrin-6A reductase [Marinomonas balearica]TDO99401.1 precorrin-6A/cobalt-precorrin-6A reductase [Marinomonas balearica]
MKILKILLLGGTADARQLADQLHLRGVHVIYSIAGLVRVPRLGCEVLVGGFTQFGGLERYLTDHNISLVVNATHPYALNMTNTAVRASKKVGVDCWRFLRPEWQIEAGDNWIYYENEDQLINALSRFQRPLLSAGQHSQEFIMSVAGLSSIDVVCWRTAVTPKFMLPDDVKWQKAIGPFNFESERAFIGDNHIDVIVSKNSGGKSTYAKLEVARKQSIPVLMHRRPITETASATYSSHDEIMDDIIDFSNKFCQKNQAQKGSTQQ